MRIYYISRTSKDNSTQVEHKAIEKNLEEATRRAREFLCPDCLDRKCQTGSMCAALLTLADGIAWEMTAGNAEMN